MSVSASEPTAIDPPSEPAGRGKKSVALFVGGAFILGAAAVGTVAYSKLSSSGDYPFMHMQDGAFAYAQVNLDPSSNQKMAINKLTKAFPELKKDGEGSKAYEALTSDNINGKLIEESLGGDFSWVGDRLGVAAYDDIDNDGEPEISLLIEAKENPKDSDKALLLKSLKEDFPNIREENVANGKYLGYTSVESEAFTPQLSLTNNTRFTEDFKAAQGNVFGFWIDTEALPEDLQEEALDLDMLGGDASGRYTGTVEAHADGLDAQLFTTGSSKPGAFKALAAADASRVGDTLSDNSYENPVGGFAVGNLGQIIVDFTTQLEEQDVPEATGMADEGLSEFGLTSADLPGLLGKVTSFSAAHNGTGFALTLHASDVDENLWADLEADGRLQALQDTLASEGEGEFKLTTDGDSADLVLGTKATGGYDAPEGQVAGYLELDQLRLALGLEDEVEDGLGKITFSQDTDADGNGKAVLGWRITR